MNESVAPPSSPPVLSQRDPSPSSPVFERRRSLRRAIGLKHSNSQLSSSAQLPPLKMTLLPMEESSARRRNSINRLVGAIQNVAMLADHQYTDLSGQEPVSDVVQPEDSHSERYMRRVSQIRIGNECIIEGLDNILAVFSEESLNSEDLSSESEPSPNESTVFNMEALLKRKEEELRRNYEQKLQLAIQQTQAMAKQEIAKVEEKYDSEMELVRRQSFDRENAIREQSTRESNQRIANLTKMLVQNISHEIRSPLSVISTGLHIVEDKLMMKQVEGHLEISDILEMIHEIKESCRECSHVLDDIVLYEAIKRGEVKLRSEMLKIYSITKSCLKEFLLQVKLCRINLFYEDTSSASGDDDGPVVLADKEKLNHVICRFTANAIRYTPADGKVTVRVRWIPPTISGKLNAPNGLVRVEFIDTGMGLAPEVVKSLLIDDSDSEAMSLSISTQGAGLRMWICKELVHLLGGSVGVGSDGEGAGATFFFELPMMRTSYNPSKRTEFRTVAASTFGGFGDVGIHLFSQV